MIDQIPEAAAQIAFLPAAQIAFLPAVQVVFLPTGLGAGSQDLALAYLGPGAGLAALGALIAVAGVGVTTIFGLVWYPVREIRRKLKESRNGGRKASRSQADSDRESSPDSPSGSS